MKKKILAVDDEAGIRTLISEVLTIAGFDVTLASDGLQALDLFRKELFDLVILDINLPKIDGFTLLEKIRESKPSLPIIMLSARVEKDDVTRGLRTGADDYIRKPFSVEELVLRVEALLRRTTATDVKKLICGPIEVDVEAHKVTFNSEEVDLSKTEFNLLVELIAQPNIVHSKDRLLDVVWGLDFETSTNVVDTYISYLRKKLHRDGYEGIKTVRGIGFKLEAK